MRPAPGAVGDLAHLTPGTIRDSVARAMRLVVISHEGPPPAQYAALLAGVPVMLTREQVAGLVPPSKRPAELEKHPIWVLSADDELAPGGST